ncbi:MAG: copper chaperone PCu(A)C [Actinomycetota bacterium]
MRSSRLLVGLVVLAAGAAACGGDDGVRVAGAWARTSPAMADAGAVYLQITAPGGDRLIGVSVDPAVAAMAQIHETVTAEGEAEGMGAMTMQEVGSIDLPAGETVALEPGGFHVMLMQLAVPLEAGQTLEITLTFEEAGTMVVEVPVLDDAP